MLRSWIAIFTLCAGTLNAAPEVNGEFEQMLMVQHLYLALACNGDGVDEFALARACGARDYVAWLLGQMNYCGGEDVTKGIIMPRWHKCGANDLIPPAPFPDLLH